MTKMAVIKEYADKNQEIPGTYLTPIRFWGMVPKCSNQIWLFKCRCGNETKVRCNVVGCTISCGCYRKSIEFHHMMAGNARIRKNTDPVNSAKIYWCSNYINNAKKRNIEITLSFAEMLKIASGPCYYTGIIDTFVGAYEKVKRNCKRRKAFFDEEYWSKSIIKLNGLDRIDCAKGYVEGNVVSCSEHANRAKLDYTQDEFIEMCNRVAKHHPRNTSDDEE